MAGPVEDVVADEGSGGLRGARRNARRRAEIAHDRLHRQAREIGGRALGDDRPVERLRARIVGNARILEVDGDALDRNLGASTRLPDADDDLRIERRDLGFEPRDRLAEHARHEARDKAVPVDALVIERTHGLPGGVFRLAVERLEAREKNGFRHGHCRPPEAMRRGEGESWTWRADAVKTYRRERWTCRAGRTSLALRSFLARSGHCAVQPPSIERLAPVICAAASEQR